jgi:hypothetical protein
MLTKTMGVTTSLSNSNVSMQAFHLVLFLIMTLLFLDEGHSTIDWTSILTIPAGKLVLFPSESKVEFVDQLSNFGAG